MKIVSTNTHVKVDGAYAALSTDQFMISGCPFMMGNVPSPCMTVKWLVADMRDTVNKAATLSSGSTGLCMSAAQVPQGPVNIVNTQTKVKSQ